ncbi:MAG: S41 family peptidase [Planctomycetota bacterium]
MTALRKRWSLWGLTLVVASGVHLSAPPVTVAQPAAPLPATPGLEAQDWSDRLWKAAAADDTETVLSLLSDVPEGVDDGRVTGLRESIDSYLTNLEKQNTRRSELIDAAWADLREARDAEGPALQAVSNALREAVELTALVEDPAEILRHEEIAALIEQAETLAAESVEARNWLSAAEIYARLVLMYDDGVSYRDELERLARKQAIISLYAPEAFWELRNNHRITREMDELPPFNPRGEAFTDKLKGISSMMILQAIHRSTREHIDTDARGMTELFLAGLEGVRSLAATPELGATFPLMRDESAIAGFVEILDEQRATVEGPAYRPTFPKLDNMLKRLVSAAERRLGLPPEAVLHEFGVGAIGNLDDFSDLIWPHDIERFERITRGRFAGVGISIRLDELSNIHVVTPLSGTPAQRAGIRAGDIIRKVDGDSTEGFDLDQAVDNITGPQGTSVVLTIEREVEEDGGETEIVTRDIEITRAEIDLPTVKGWELKSPAEDDWDWFIDEANGIGFVRLSGFSDKTSLRLDRAIRAMQDMGVRGLILDLRFNPGGLLDQAVEVSNRFVREGDIVSTVDAGRSVQQLETAVANKASLTTLPTVVLINENSASASEIVSGAVKHYADQGELTALVLGERSYGKGSVQNLYPIGRRGAEAMLKLTTQYYRLPNGRILHRRPGADAWGVEPNYHASLLPEQIGEMLKIRQNADVIPLDEFGRPIAELAPEDPGRLLTEGIDLQLQTALVLLQAKVHNSQTSSPVDKAVLNDRDR